MGGDGTVRLVSDTARLIALPPVLAAAWGSFALARFQFVTGAAPISAAAFHPNAANLGSDN